jgi:hypothetical protein
MFYYSRDVMKNSGPAVAPKVTLVEHGRHLEARLGSTNSIDALKIQLYDLLAVCNERKTERLLVDFRAYTGTMSTLDRYDIGMIGEKFASPNRNVACLLTIDLVDPQKFGARVAQNRGLRVDVFTDVAEAERWLLA